MHLRSRKEIKVNIWLAAIPVAAGTYAHAQLIRVPTGSKRNSPGRELRKRQDIFGLAAIGAGLLYFPRNEREMDADVDDLSRSVTARYLLAYTKDGPALVGWERRVEAMIDEAHGGKKLVVRAPEGYYAPSE